MSEWRLFPEGETPYFTTPEFFRGHPWIPPGHQIGHAERTAMTAEAVRTLVADEQGITDVVELGCGDGALAELIAPLVPTYIGYDACLPSLEQARAKGLIVHVADIRNINTYGVDLAISCEVIEHMADPHAFVASIESRFLVLTSPCAEDDVWHYEHHAWAWDTTGYRAMVERAGWEVLSQVTCEAPPVTFAGGTRNHGFQCIVAKWGE